MGRLAECDLFDCYVPLILISDSHGHCTSVLHCHCLHSVILAAYMVGLLTGSLDDYFQGFPMDLGQTRGRY